MNKRLRETRIFSMKILYNMAINNLDFSIAWKHVFSNTDIDDDALSLTEGILARKAEIDELISNNLENYRINRLNLVDKAIIEIATYEMLNNLPASIAINEALEITRSYSDLGDNKAVSFNNRLLEKIKVAING